MAWWRKPQPEVETRSYSISDPVMAAYFGIDANYSGVSVGEQTALGIAAVYRAVSLISGTIASLPLKTYRDVNPGERQQVASLFDNPGTDEGLTPYAWKETVMLHLLLHGEAYLAHVFNGAGALTGLVPVHPSAVRVEDPKKNQLDFDRTFVVTLRNGLTREFTPATMTQVLGQTLDGLRGLSVIGVARNSFGAHIAMDRAAARAFGNGMTIAGLVTPEEDLSDDDAAAVKAGLNKKLTGWENAGDIALVNRKLKFQPWTMSLEDAQFLESRQFQIEEIARWFGIPPFELMQTEKQTSWGTGIEAQQRGLARGPLLAWTTRMEQVFSRLLPAPRFVEFDFTGLERPTPEQEIELLIAQVQAGILTVNEARAIRNMAPLDQPAADVAVDPAEARQVTDV